MIDFRALIEKVQIRTGMHVADFGCGRSGHLVFPLAKIVGAKGSVYAVDVLKETLEIISQRAKSEAHIRVHPVWADIERIGEVPISAGSLDVIFLVNTLVQCDNRHAVLEEARRLLKDKARFVIVDWFKKGMSFGPDDERFVDFLDIVSWARMHGYGVQEEFLMGPFHKGVVLLKQE